MSAGRARTPSDAGSRTDHEAEDLLRKLKHPRDAEIRAVRKLILDADRRVRERVKWNAPSLYTSEHFATFNLRARDVVQLVLHLGAKPRPESALPERIPDPESLLTWKGPDRALLTIRDAAHLRKVRGAVAGILAAWISHVE